MHRNELEHIIRASAAIVDEQEIVILGSQSILGPFPEAPEPLLVSMEADVYPQKAPEKAIVIDGAIGENSIFHNTFGYYAHGVGEDTAKLPEGWKNRFIEIRNANTNGATGLCLEQHDLAASKLVAGRPGDLEFVRVMLTYKLTDAALMESRTRQIPDLQDVEYHLQILQRLVKDAGENFSEKSG